MEINRRIPKKIQEKTSLLLQKLANHSYTALGGKRLTVRENGLIRVSFPVAYKYRLICLFDGTKCEPKELITHEAYNKLYCQ